VGVRGHAEKGNGTAVDGRYDTGDDTAKRGGSGSSAICKSRKSRVRKIFRFQTKKLAFPIDHLTSARSVSTQR